MASCERLTGTSVPSQAIYSPLHVAIPLRFVKPSHAWSIQVGLVSLSWMLKGEHLMSTVKIATLAAVLLGLAGLIACNDKDADEQQTSASKAVAGQQTASGWPQR